MKASGKPTPEELALLEPHRATLPPEVFGEVYTPPVSDASGSDRRLLREAARLLTAAGWKQDGSRRINEKGEPFEVEFLASDPTSERLIGPYLKNLQAIGIDANVRRVDPAQYERRRKTFDFDIVIQRYVMRLTPGVELKNYFGSEAADADGSFNLSGIKRPRRRRPDREGDGRQGPHPALDGGAGHGSRATRRPLLGLALVQGQPRHGLLEPLLQTRRETPLCPRRHRYLVVRRRQSCETAIPLALSRTARA